MKKIFRYKFFVAAALLATLASCSEDDDKTKSTRLEKPVISVAVSPTTVTEGETITVTLTADKAISDAMEFKLDLLPSSTGSFRDYLADGDEMDINTGFGDIGYTITMPAYTTSYTFTITPQIDLEVEGTETFDFRFYGDGNSKGIVDSSTELFTVSVNDYVSNDVGFKLTWDGNYTDAYGTIHEGTYLDPEDEEALFTSYDFDFYILDESFNEVTGYAAATGASPEEAVFDSSLPDGDYLIVADLYAAGDVPAEPFDFNIYFEISKYGTWKSTLAVPYSSDSADSYPDGLAGGLYIAAVLTKTGTTYTLTDYNTEEVLAQGRVAQLNALVRSKRIARK